MKTYDVPMYGSVMYTERVEADTPSEAIDKAYEVVSKINEKEEIYTNFEYETMEGDVQEVDVEEEKKVRKRALYLMAKMDELGGEEFFKTQPSLIHEYEKMEAA